MFICENLFLLSMFDISFEIHFLREQFPSVLMFWNTFSERAIILIFDLWLLISVAAALCFLLKSPPQATFFQFWQA